MPHATNDRLIHAAIKDGEVRVDAETGHVEINGWRARGQRSGYLTVTAKGQSVLAHRVMWIYHYPETPETLQVNHRNGRRWDNRLSNLELVTPTDNVRHAVGREYAAVNDIDDSDSCPRQRLARHSHGVSRTRRRHYGRDPRAEAADPHQRQRTSAIRLTAPIQEHPHVAEASHGP